MVLTPTAEPQRTESLRREMKINQSETKQVCHTALKEYTEVPFSNYHTFKFSNYFFSATVKACSLPIISLISLIL